MTTDSKKGENAFWTLASAQLPTFCVTLAAVIVLAALYASGYLTPDGHLLALREFEQAFRGSAPTPFDATTVAAHRGALAVSGILLAATVALSITAVFWAVSNTARYLDKIDGRKVIFLAATAVCTLVCGEVIFALIGVAIDRLNASLALISVPASRLLDMTAHDLPDAKWLDAVPPLMFIQSFMLPMVLAFGVSFRLSPPEPADPPTAPTADPTEAWLRWLTGSTEAQAGARRRLGDLTARVRELDHVLYIGALALVFGTLQLSAALSVPLTLMPAATDVRTTIDLCKAGTAAGNPFVPAPAPAAAESAVARSKATGGAKSKDKTPPAPAASTPAAAKKAASTANPVPATPPAAFHRALTPEDCQGVATEWARVNVAQSVRSLIRALTTTFGLAFSLLLGAIYVPAILRLRKWIDESREALAGQADADLGDADPVRRIAAVAATLGPAIAALVANTLSSG